jgi:hypothetical protein
VVLAVAGSSDVEAVSPAIDEPGSAVEALSELRAATVSDADG